MSINLNSAQRNFMSLVGSFAQLPRASQGVVVTCIAILLSLSLLLLLKALVLWDTSLDRIDSAESRLARLEGYVDSQASFIKAASQAKAMAGRMSFPDSGESGRGEALLQQTVRQLAGDSGLTITGSELRSPEGSGALFKLTVGLTLTGNPDDLITFLRAVNMNKPLLFVEQVQLNDVNSRAVRGRTNVDGAVSAELVISAFRLAPDEGQRGAE